MNPTLLLALALTFAEARARGAAANPDLRALRIAEPIARANVEAAGQLPNPTLAGNVGGEDPQWAISIDQRLPFLGQRQHEVAAARARVPVAQAEIAAGEAQLLARIRRAYFALAAAQAKGALAGEASALAEKLEAAARERFENGSAPELELLQASVARGRAKQEELAARGQLQSARGELGALLGQTGEELATLAASDPLGAGESAPALEQLLSRQQEHPEPKSKLLASQASLAEASAARAAIIPAPDVSIAVEHGSQAPTTSLRAGLSFELPLLSQNGGKVRAAELEAERAEAEAAAARARLAAELRAARERWEAARARESLATGELVPAAEKLLALARTGYELGRAPLLAVLSAQGELLASRTAALDAALEVQDALADLEEAIGAAL